MISAGGELDARGNNGGHGDDSVGHVQNGTRERGEGRMEARVCRGVDGDLIGAGERRMAAAWRIRPWTRRQQPRSHG